MRYIMGMHRASLTLTLRVVELTVRLSLENSRPASKRPGVTALEPRPLVNARGPVLQLKTGTR